QLILADLLYFSHYSNSIYNDISSNVYRLFSILGHPLTNTFLIISFIILNICYNHYYLESTNFKLNTIYIYTIIGALLSNSKLGIIIIAIIFISVLVINKKSSKYLLVLLIPLIIALSRDFLLNNILKRFEYASTSGDFTNGRITALKILLENNYIPN